MVLRTYIATTRYSKEERASLELGDTVYPYDRFVEVLTPDIGGVVVLVTSLPPDSLARLLSSHYLSAVEYVTYVISCASCYGADVDSVASYVLNSACRTACFSKVRTPRAGSLGWKFIGGIRARVSECVS
ncbi:MAG: hypothetical protein RMH84_06730, partial [Sulfolobales archaeon]|nr:hypothetical protein [Sulfolobales archaeon]